MIVYPFAILCFLPVFVSSPNPPHWLWLCDRTDKICSFHIRQNWPPPYSLLQVRVLRDKSPFICSGCSGRNLLLMSHFSPLLPCLLQLQRAWVSTVTHTVRLGICYRECCVLQSRGSSSFPPKKHCSHSVFLLCLWELHFIESSCILAPVTSWFSKTKDHNIISIWSTT